MATQIKVNAGSFEDATAHFKTSVNNIRKGLESLNSTQINCTSSMHGKTKTALDDGMAIICKNIEGNIAELETLCSILNSIKEEFYFLDNEIAKNSFG